MPLAISINVMRSEVLRELGFRARVYPRWVTQGKLRAEAAAAQTERMEALLEVLEEVRLARAFQAALVREMLPEEILKSLRDVGGFNAAWLAWCAPRHAPLTMGTHAAQDQG